MTDLIGRLDELLLLVDSQVELVNIKEQELYFCRSECITGQREYATVFKIKWRMA